MRILSRLAKEERGSALVLIALMMTVLMGFTALVIDIGLLAVSKNKLTVATDAAALAGAQELPNTTLARQRAEEYIQANGVPLSQVAIDFPSGTTTIRVQANQQVDYLFAPVIGKESGLVNATSRAGGGAITSMRGIVPLAVLEQEFVFGQEYQIKVGSGDTGWFGPVALGLRGASTYESNIRYGYPSYVNVGDTIETEPGNISGPTSNGIQYRLNSCNHYPKCTIAAYEENCPRIVHIPVVNAPGQGGRADMAVQGFAAFLLKSETIGSGNENIINGYFIRKSAVGIIDFNRPDFGVKGYKLTE